MVVTNLKPATLAGVKSEGMILCAEDADGNLSLMVPEKKMLPALRSANKRKTDSAVSRSVDLAAEV